ncbi:MAG: hypothetical protein HC838_17525 [Spirulinaceae cyanobacterium RM2_2_10]|nr:hypothetical protein [Spirulinaceae cyanobacterium SM2_1_0]NJO21479.1 hypothetical protein [Spirulinaceae cyanobacterium RM2_2_10]
MNDQQFQELLQALRYGYAQRQRMIELLETINAKLDLNAAAPNFERQLSDFGDFDWASIQARVIERDRYGPTLVEWRGRQYKRRSPDNKFGAAIWFSRAIGKEGDRVKYERLITFRSSDSDEVEPISRQAERWLES